MTTPSASTGTTAAALRRFNRSFTRRIGVLQESFLDSGRPLGAARLLFEIGGAGASVLELRSRLGLDSGYLSRLLRGLEADGMVVVDPDDDDRRRRVARLTDRGREAWHDLDRRSDRLADDLVAPLSPRQRARLRAALDDADRLLRIASVTFDLVDPRSDDAIASMRAYFDELDRRFPTGFDPGDTLVADAGDLAPPHGAFVVVHADHEPVACGGVQRHDDRSAEIKRMWVHPDWRGEGLGPRLLAELEAHARRLGHERVVLDTNATLREAIAMYERAGYGPVARYNENPYAERWFAKQLTTRSFGV